MKSVISVVNLLMTGYKSKQYDGLHT